MKNENGTRGSLLLQATLVSGAIGLLVVGLIRVSSYSEKSASLLKARGSVKDINQYIRAKTDCARTFASQTAACSTGARIDVLDSAGTVLLTKNDPPTTLGGFTHRATCNLDHSMYAISIQYGSGDPGFPALPASTSASVYYRDLLTTPILCPAIPNYNYDGLGLDGEVMDVMMAPSGPPGTVYISGHFLKYGNTWARNLLRLLPDGSLDPTFTTGVGTTGNSIFKMDLAQDGSEDLIIGGVFTTYQGATRNGVARINKTGALLPALNAGTNIQPPVVWDVRAVPDGSGDVYVGGEFKWGGLRPWRIIRLKQDGTLNNSFAIGEGLNASSSVQSIELANDGTGDLYAGGWFLQFNNVNIGPHIIRIRANGTNNTTFNTGTGFNAAVYAIKNAPDGSGDIYVGGSFNAYKGVISPYIIRLKPDGSKDTTFAVGAGFDGEVYGIEPALDGTGDIFVSGTFNTYKGVNARKLVRLNRYGATVTAFDTTSAYGGLVRNTAYFSPGYLYVGGNYTTFNAQYIVKHISRLNMKGQLNTP